MGNSGLTDARLAEIRRRVESAYQPDVFGWRTRLDMAILDSMALLADNECLHAALAAAEAREAALVEIVAIVAGCPRTPDDVAHLAISHAMSDKARALLAATETKPPSGE